MAPTAGTARAGSMQGGAKEIPLPIAALGGADFVQHFAAQDVEQMKIRRELDVRQVSSPEPREQSPGA